MSALNGDVESRVIQMVDAEALDLPLFHSRVPSRGQSIHGLTIQTQLDWNGWTVETRRVF